MKVIVAANDTGAIKEVVFNRGTDTSKQDGVQPISVKNFCGDENSRTRVLQMVNFCNKYIIASRLGGRICVYNLENHGEEIPDEEKYNMVHAYQLTGLEVSDKSIALIPFEDEDAVVVAFESGKVFFIKINGESFDVDPIEVQLGEKLPLSVFEANPDEAGVFAYGGKEVDVKIVRLFDTSSSLEEAFENRADNVLKVKTLFTAKNVKNDHLDLRVPVWITGIKFLQSSKKESYNFVTTTRYGQVRIYDTSEGKRPRYDYQLCEKPILTVNFSSEDHSEIIISDTHSLIGKYSLTQVDSRGFQMHSASAGNIVKPTLKLLGKYLGGNTGATFGTDVVEDEMFAAAGLDRYFRLFDVETREVIAKIYLGVEASSLILLDIEDEEIEGQEEDKANEKKRSRDKAAVEEDEEEDEEELWAQLGDEETTNKKMKK